jgi:hypothetical protein
MDSIVASQLFIAQLKGVAKEHGEFGTENKLLMYSEGFE